MGLTDFGRQMHARVESCADELTDVLPRWTDDQRRNAERVICIHLLHCHGAGMRDAARMIRLDGRLTLAERNRLADQIEQAILDRKEWV
jgi:hypothetical protein